MEQTVPNNLKAFRLKAGFEQKQVAALLVCRVKTGFHTGKKEKQCQV